MTVRINSGNIARDKARIGQQWGHRIGGRVQNAARKRTPVDTGALRTSIEYTVDVRPNLSLIHISEPTRPY